jgi:hypothetical protein
VKGCYFCSKSNTILIFRIYVVHKRRRSISKREKERREREEIGGREEREKREREDREETRERREKGEKRVINIYLFISAPLMIYIC